MTKRNIDLNYISGVPFWFFSQFSRDSIHILTSHFKFLYYLFVCLLQIADTCTGDGLSVHGCDTILLGI
jgi:hypothetical protein